MTDVLFEMDDKVLRLIVYFSKKLTPAECNYMIYNKILLTIVKSFEIWRPELASTANQVKVYMDYRNLEYFMTTKQRNQWQVRWAEFLSEFNFKIIYRPGKQGKKPDMLTQRSQNILEKVEGLWQ